MYRDDEQNSQDEVSSTSPSQAIASDPILLDFALPYVESMSESYEQYALALIEDEMKKIVTPPVLRTANESKPLKYHTEMMKHEFENILKQEADRGGYGREFPSFPIVLSPSLQSFPSSASSSVFDESNRLLLSDTSTVDDWQRAVERARIEYELERVTSMLLAVDKEENSDLWKQWNAVHQIVLTNIRKQNEIEQQAVEEINHARQAHQIQAGERLHILTSQYYDLVSKLNRLRHAISLLSLTNFTMHKSTS